MNFPANSADATCYTRVSKLLLIMKLSFILIICFVFQVNASSFAQRVTLRKNNVTLKVLFKEIKKQTGYDIIYADKVIDDKKTLDVSFEQTPLDAVLFRTLKGRSVDFVLEGSSIILSKSIPQAIDKPVAKDTEMEGKITDENNKPMVGVTVRAATSASNSARAASAQLLYTTTTLSNSEGVFRIKTDERTLYLVFSYVGYENKIIKIDGQKNFKVTMTLSKNPLDEVQIIAYGSTTKRYLTGSVATLKQDQIEKQPVSNPLQAMEGRLAGVFITEGAGVPGAGISVQIRGNNTLSAGRNPLYIIDGVPFNAQATENSAGAIFSPTQILGPSGLFSPFDNIPTSDIESIEVLKDADATAIYGSRAANGVVVITTRKGKVGSMKVNANLYSGVSEITSGVDMLNTQQYLALRRQAFTNDNIAQTTTNAPDLLSFGDGYTDFLETIMGKKANFTDATLSISGGNKLTQYLISGNYRHQGTVLPGDFADNKSTVRFSIQSQSENSKFAVSLSGAYTKNSNNLPAANTASVYSLPPNLPIYNPDGSFYWNNNYTNPIAALLGPKNVTTDNIIANGTLSYKIIPGLSFKTDMGFNRINFDAVTASTRASRNPNTTTTGSVTLQNNYNQVYSIEPQLNFSREIGPGRLDALAGATYQYSQYVQPFLILGTFTNDALYTNLGSITITLPSSGYNDSKYASLFGRLTYTLADKYILSFNGRRDGSSRFGPGNKYGNFGSAGATWIFSDEDFLKDNLSWLSFGKLRTSYGTLGNDQIGDYAYLALYASSGLAPSYSGVTTLVPSGLANPDLQWEVTKKLDIAADLGFLKNRISLSVDWYRNVSNNLIVYSPTASQTGFTGFTGNLPATVENKGWEFTLDTKNIIGKDFSWSTSVNLTIPKNRLLKFDNIKSSFYASSYIVGQSLSTVQGYHFTGFVDGIAQFQDLDGNGVISAGANTVTGVGDYANIGNTDPKFYGGLSNTFKYKGFQLDFLFQFVKKDGYNIYNVSAVPGVATNVPADILNLPVKYTTLAGSVAGAAFTRYKTSDATFGDASYLRLKTLSLNYNFNTIFSKKLGMQNLNVYMRGQNLFTVSNYLGFDPETLGSYIPPTKLISLGIQATF